MRATAASVMFVMTPVSTGKGSSPGSPDEGEGVCTGVTGKAVSVVWDVERMKEPMAFRSRHIRESQLGGKTQWSEEG